MDKSTSAVVLGDGAIYKKTIKVLGKKCKVLKSFLQKKNPNYVFYISKETGKKEIEDVLVKAVGSYARILLLVPSSINSEAIFREANNLDLNIRIIKSPDFLLGQEIENSAYVKKCADIIIDAMFAPNTRGGLFFLPEPTFAQPVASIAGNITHHPKKMKIPFLKIATFVILIFCLPIIIVLVFLSIGFMSLKLFETFYLSGEVKKSEAVSNIAIFSFDRGQDVNNFIVFKGFREPLKAGSSLAGGAYHLSLATEKIQDPLTSLLSKNYNPKALKDVSQELLSAREEFIQAGIAFGNINLPIFNEKINVRQSKVNNFAALLDKAIALLDIIPDVIPEDGKKTYLVLLQNNMEIRATGGFIGSYGLLSFEDSKFQGFSVFDVYSADGQLKGHVEPPFAIKKYLEQPHWYLRDSNWDPSFDISAARAVWFLDKEVGQKVDGVIAIDTQLISLLVEALGSVSLPDYQETITKNNIAERANYWAHKDFFAGSTAKADFIASLSRALIEKLQNDKNVSQAKVFKNLIEGAEKKHIMFEFNDPQIQRFFILNNLSGTLADSRIDKEDSLNDFLMIVDSNLGINKVNYFIKRKISQKIDIDEQGIVTETLEIDYTNESQKENYKNYLRIVTPRDSKLKRVDLDGEEIGEVNIEENDKTTFGFLVNIPQNAQKKINISYELEKAMPIAKGINFYSLKILKQPGTIADPIKFNLTYPGFLSITRVDKDENLKPFLYSKLLTIYGDLSKDREIKVELLSK